MFKIVVLNCLHLTFISRVMSQYYKQDKIYKIFIFLDFSYKEQLKFHAHKMFYNLWVWIMYQFAKLFLIR